MSPPDDAKEGEAETTAADFAVKAEHMKLLVMAVAHALIAVSADPDDKATPEDAFNALSAEEQLYMVQAADAAIMAHTQWLGDNGFRIAPPGTMLRPKSDLDARAMIQAGQEFLAQPEHARQRRKTLVAGPSLILPPGTRKH